MTNPSSPPTRPTGREWRALAIFHLQCKCNKSVVGTEAWLPAKKNTSSTQCSPAFKSSQWLARGITPWVASTRSQTPYTSPTHLPIQVARQLEMLVDRTRFEWRLIFSPWALVNFSPNDSRGTQSFRLKLVRLRLLFKYPHQMMILQNHPRLSKTEITRLEPSLSSWLINRDDQDVLKLSLNHNTQGCNDDPRT